jgi:S-adenosylmethionine:tRNA ribosyltransferase-isomerase
MDKVQYKKSDFYYYLPESQIAQTPAEPRDSSRLLVYNREKDQVEHVIFHEVVNYLKAGDVLVVNNTKVLPARLYAHTPNGGVVEVLLLKRIDKDTWEVLVKPGKKCKIGKTFNIGDKLSFTVTDITDSGERIVKFSYDGVFEEILDEVGSMPLPPYIKEKLKDKDRYQTVYAKTEGSAAAPTAGLHFTPQLLQKIKDMGVEVVEVLLHVGLGTFRPVKEDIITDHKMHSEYYEVSEKAAAVVNKAKSEGRRIIAVGTTSVRTLESATDESGVLHSGSGNTQIFIYPPYKFKCVDALITNFHLPESTLIMLVAALVGREKILSLYDLAVKEGYRFFSFGDAMFIV